MTREGIAKIAVTQPKRQTGTLGAALQEAAHAYLERYGEETREPMRRPKDAAPRRERDWR